MWRSRALRVALAAFPLWFTVSLLVFNAPWRFRLIVVAQFVLSALAPHAGLVAIAALVPLGRLIQIGLSLQPFRVTEALVLAFFAGWLTRARTDRDGPRVPALLAWLFAAIVGASVLAQLWAAASEPGRLLENLQVIYQAYFLIPERIGFASAALLFEGLGLMAATAILLRARPSLANTLPIAMVAAAIVAAVGSVLLSRGISFPQILEEHARLVPRTSAIVGDSNAAASYFGMMLFVALGMAARAHPAARVVWLLAATAQLVAVDLTASRTGEAVVVLVLVFGIVSALTWRWRPGPRRAALVGMLAIVLVGGLARTWMLREDPGARFRRQFYSTSLRMIEARPMTGIGVGRYYDDSMLYLPAETSWTYAFQNAHNYFLQVAAESGLVGLALLLALVGVIIWRSGRAILRSPRDMRLLGCTLGAAAMLMTWLTGHPMLLPEIALPFWMVLGLVAALSGSVLIGTGEISRRPETRPRGMLVAAVAIVVVTALSMIPAAGRELEPSTSAAVMGVEPWETDRNGERFRWTHEYASVFVPARATRVYIPVRMPVDLPRLSPMPVDIQIGGEFRGRMLVGDDWAILNLELPYAQPLQRFKRIDLRVQRTWQPGVYVQGSGDLRKVGVQMGEIKEFYEY